MTSVTLYGFCCNGGVPYINPYEFSSKVAIQPIFDNNQLINNDASSKLPTSYEYELTKKWHTSQSSNKATFQPHKRSQAQTAQSAFKPDGYQTKPQTISYLNPTEHRSHLLPTSCKNYSLTFTETQGHNRRLTPSVGCRCPLPGLNPHCLGSHSRIRRSLSNNSEDKSSEPLFASTNNNNSNHSFRIFLYLAIVPLAFGLFAAVTAFACKMCCCDCFDTEAGMNFSYRARRRAQNQAGPSGDTGPSPTAENNSNSNNEHSHSSECGHTHNETPSGNQHSYMPIFCRHWGSKCRKKSRDLDAEMPVGSERYREHCQNAYNRAVEAEQRRKGIGNNDRWHYRNRYDNNIDSNNSNSHSSHRRNSYSQPSPTRETTTFQATSNRSSPSISNNNRRQPDELQPTNRYADRYSNYIDGDLSQPRRPANPRSQNHDRSSRPANRASVNSNSPTTPTVRHNFSRDATAGDHQAVYPLIVPERDGLLGLDPAMPGMQEMHEISLILGPPPPYDPPPPYTSTEDVREDQQPSV